MNGDVRLSQKLKVADFWEEAGGDTVKCLLCPHECTIAEGMRGICGARKNVGGVLYSLSYGLVVSSQIDPIEKKPLYHFHPGTSALSFGTWGCNLRCAFCQNHTLSQRMASEGPEGRVGPEAAADAVVRSGCGGVAWTYNEPTIWLEFARDTSKLVHEKGLYSVLVTNGFINPEPLREIAPHIDAMNIDVKAFRDDFYTGTCKGRLSPVVRACELAASLGIHLELTNLVIPGSNDDMGEIREMCQWVHDSLGPETVMHFSRYHPDYRFTAPPTPPGTLNRAGKVARKVGLKHVYIGNLNDNEFLHTRCPGCGKVVVWREPMGIRKDLLVRGRCPYCGYLVMKHA